MQVFALALCAVIAAFLLWPVRAGFRLRLNGLKIAVMTTTLYLFSGLARVSFKLELNILKEPALTLYQIKKRRSSILWSIGRRTKAIGKIQIPTMEVIRKLSLHDVQITGELGIKDDAFATAILAGMLMNALILPIAAFINNGTLSKAASPSARILPAFNENKLLLNLTGIASFVPFHIISTIVIWSLKAKTNGIIKRRSRKENTWHIL